MESFWSFCYLVEDFEDLKLDVEVIKVLTEESEGSEDFKDLKPDRWHYQGSDWRFWSFLIQFYISSFHVSSTVSQKPMKLKIRSSGHVIK